MRVKLQRNGLVEMGDSHAGWLGRIELRHTNHSGPTPRQRKT